MSTSIARIQSEATALDAARPQHAQTAVGFVQLLDEHWRLAKMLVSSGMLPKAVNRPEAAMAILLKAYELQIPAMYAFANLHYFDGRLVESAALMVGMATERCSVTYEVVEWNDERCELLFHRPGWSKPLPSTFTMEDAKRAGLTGKDNWKKWPRAMLLARAQAQGVRAIAPDRFGGMYSSEEVRDFAGPLSAGSGEHAAAVRAALHADDEIPEAEATVINDRHPLEEEDPHDPPHSTLTEQDGPELDEFEQLAGSLEISGGDANDRQRRDLMQLANDIYGQGTVEALGLRAMAENEALGAEQARPLLSAARAVLMAREKAGAT